MNAATKGNQFLKPEGNEYKRILSYYSHKWIYIICILFNIVGGVIPYLIMLNLGNIFDDKTSNSKLFLSNVSTKLKNMAILSSVMIVILNLSYALRSFSDTLFVKDIRDLIFQNLLKLDLSFFDEIQTGILMCNLSEDVTIVLAEYVNKFMNFVQNAAQIIGGIIIGFIVNWKISLIGVLILPITIAILWICGKFLRKEILKNQFQSSYLMGKTEEVISNFRTVKSFDSEIYFKNFYFENLDGINKNGKKISKINAIRNSILLFFTFVMAVPIFYYGSFLIIVKNETNLKPGDLVFLFTVFGMLGMPIQTALISIENFQKASISAAKILRILDKKPFVNQKAGQILKDVKGKIEFNNVSFKYQTQSDYVLKDVSFTINQGETVAFVGESGSGKSTIVQLIQRFYEILNGQILIDGKDIREFSPESLRREISVVSQEPKLFSMSIADNIRYCSYNMDIEKEKIVEAAQKGNAHNFIMELSNSYDTFVTQNNLSGGQKQRISISRAIFKNSPIIAFDEATSFLDAESEQLVQQSIDCLKDEKTCIIITHKLSKIVNANQIFVLQNGSIVEKGTHEELMNKKGYYFDLFKYQQY